jgi:hypothetical protein
MSDFEAIIFCRLFPYNQRLEYLDLSANVIKDYGFMAISEWLGTNSTLLFLNISNNDLEQLKDKTLDLLMTTLSEHPNLQTVHMSEQCPPVLRRCLVHWFVTVRRVARTLLPMAFYSMKTTI